MARDVFISYQHNDQATAQRVCAALEQARISCWIAPRDIRPGQEWATGIVEGIGRCHTLVVILSVNTKTSRQISRELELADKAGLRMIAFRLAEIEPPPQLIYFLGNVQWVDSFDDQLNALDRLREAIIVNEKFPAAATKSHPAQSIQPPPNPWRSWSSLPAKVAIAASLTAGLGFATYIGVERHVARQDYAKAWALLPADPSAARYEFTEAIAADSEFYEAYCGLAGAYLKLNDPQSAQRALWKAFRLRKDPVWARTLNSQIQQALAAKTTPQS